MAGEHINVLMAAEAPARKAFAVDRYEAEGWVEVAEYASLQNAQDARDRIIDEGILDEDEVRVRGERGQRLLSRLWLSVLAVLAVVNVVLYVAMLTTE